MEEKMFSGAVVQPSTRPSSGPVGYLYSLPGKIWATHWQIIEFIEHIRVAFKLHVF
jgi:hypothetical protein